MSRLAEDHTRYRHEQLIAALNKYACILLAVAASVITLALNRAANESLIYGQVPLGVAVTCWGMRFAFAYRNLAWMNATLQANAAISMV